MPIALRTTRRKVNRTYGQPSNQLHERHEADDFETKTQDKLVAESTTGGS